MNTVNEEETVFEELTNLAFVAAKQGKWDAVAHFYQRRVNAGSFESIPRDIAKKLMQTDQWIMTRIQEIQTLTQQQLEEVQQHRRQLEGLKRQWGSQAPFQASHRLSV